MIPDLPLYERFGSFGRSACFSSLNTNTYLTLMQLMHHRHRGDLVVYIHNNHFPLIKISFHILIIQVWTDLHCLFTDLSLTNCSQIKLTSFHPSETSSSKERRSYLIFYLTFAQLVLLISRDLVIHYSFCRSHTGDRARFVNPNFTKSLVMCAIPSSLPEFREGFTRRQIILLPTSGRQAVFVFRLPNDLKEGPIVDMGMIMDSSALIVSRIYEASLFCLAVNITLDCGRG